MRRDSCALGADDVQAARGDDRRRGAPAIRARSLPICRSFSVCVSVAILAQRRGSAARRAAEHDVGAAAGHVGRDGDRLRTARLRDDLGLARVLLGVQHLVRELSPSEMPGQQLGVLDRRRADEHRLAALVAILDVGDDARRPSP